MAKVLLAGESWISSTIEYKGFDSFTNTRLEIGCEDFLRELRKDGHQVTHMMAHEVPEHFPWTLEELNQYDVVILSDIGSNSLLLAQQVFYGGEYSKGMSADSVVLYPRQDRADDALGSFLVCTYEGILPAASCPGIRYTLTVRNREHSGDGTFSLTLTYLEAENGQDSSFLYTGKRFTQRGTPDDNDTTVWQFVTDDGKDTFNFLVESDSALILLNDRFERNDSEQNHTLVRIR